MFKSQRYIKICATKMFQKKFGSQYFIRKLKRFWIC